MPPLLEPAVRGGRVRLRLTLQGCRVVQRGGHVTRRVHAVYPRRICRQSHVVFMIPWREVTMYAILYGHQSNLGTTYQASDRAVSNLLPALFIRGDGS